MPDFGQCAETSCQENAVRLFDCVHHCMKRICLQHLIEHDRLIENNKRQLEFVQNELKRLYLVYSSLIDENKIRCEYEQKLGDYKNLFNQMNSILTNQTSDIDQARLFNEKLKKLIEEKQKQPNESLTIVKVEATDEPSSSLSTMDVSKDETLFIGFDRLQNLIIDTDYHRRKARENSLPKTKSPSKPASALDDHNYIIVNPEPLPSPHSPYDYLQEIHAPRTAGQCPLWSNGAYGLKQEYHYHRLCQKKYFSDLSNHMRQFHGLLLPVANIIARAAYSNIPTSKRLIPNDLQVTDPRRSFLCPFRMDCENDCWLPTAVLRAHLIESHRLTPTAAEIKIKKLIQLNKNKPMSKIKQQVYDVIRNIELTYKDQWKSFPSRS